MKQSLILSLIEEFETAFRKTGSAAGPAEAEKLACIVYRSMGNSNREFHNIGHILGFLPNTDPEYVLCAIFHDIVYYQVDGGFPADLAPLLSPWCQIRNGKADLAWPDDLVPPPPGTPEELISGVPPAASRHRDCFLLCAAVFGLEPGDSLTGRPGFNEFFSCLAMCILLEPLCKKETILAIAAGIEQSIPFRGPDAKGTWTQEHLADRLFNMLRQDGMESFTARNKAHEMVHRAILFANQDVADFGAPEASRFISGTWRLLPELNRSLRVQGHCTVSEYRRAMQGMLGFFNSLVPDQVYHSFYALPSLPEMEDLKTRTRQNLDIACEYLKAKLLGTVFLEAAAWVSGGDLPLSYFMGDIPRDDEETHRIETHLKYPLLPLCSKGTVYHLLKNGRTGKSGFDLSNSPLSLFFYEAFSPDEFVNASKNCMVFLKELDTALKQEGMPDMVRIAELCKNWMRTMPCKLDHEVLKALAHMAPTRKAALEQLCNEQMMAD